MRRAGFAATPLPAARGARRAAGFTLIEILVVTFIIGILAIVAAVNVTTDKGAQLRDNAAQLYNAMALAQEEAVLQNEWIGLYLTAPENADDWRFRGYRWLISNDEAQTWRPLDSPYLQDHTLPGGMTMDLTVGGEDSLDRLQDGRRRHVRAPEDEDKAQERRRTHPPPHVFFYPDGGSDAFELLIEAEDAPGRFRKIFSDELGRLEQEADDGVF